MDDFFNGIIRMLREDIRHRQRMVERHPTYQVKCGKPWCPYDFSNYLSPIEIVKGIPNGDFKFTPLTEPETDPCKHITNGVMDYRMENGHSIIYLQEYTQPKDVEQKIAECQKWHERNK